MTTQITRLSPMGMPGPPGLLGQSHIRIYKGQDGQIDYNRVQAVMDAADTQVTIGGKIKLRWRYAAFGQAAVPDAFRIYQDDLLVATVNVKGASLARGQRALPPWTSGALTHGQLYRYQVRAYHTVSGGESLNSSSVSIAADSVGPTAITGLTATVEAIG